MPVDATYSVTEYVACYNRTMTNRELRGIMTDSKNHQALVPSIKLPDDILLNLAAVSDTAKSMAEQVNMQLQPSQDVIDKLSSLVNPIMESTERLREVLKSQLPNLGSKLNGYSIVNLEDLVRDTKIEFGSYDSSDVRNLEPRTLNIIINITPGEPK